MNENNNNILNSLIGNQEEKNIYSCTRWCCLNREKQHITVSRVVGVRYKFYTVILLLVFILWYSYILPSYEEYEYTKVELSNTEQLSDF